MLTPAITKINASHPKLKKMLKKSVLIFISGVIGLMICSGALEAQEVQVPVCDKIQVITPSMAAEIDFFSAYPGFQQATVYQTPDSLLFIEILYQKDGSIIRERKPMNSEDINLICAQLKLKDAVEVVDDIDFDRDGRRKLIASTMAYSLAYYAWAIPASFDAKSDQAYTGSYLLLASAGFFVPLMATQKGDITNGMAKGYTYGCFLGIGHGISLGALLTGDFDNSFNLGVGVLASIGEGLGGLYYARKHQFNRAHMRTIGSMGTWGLGYGLGIPAMAESDEPAAYAASSIAVSAIGIFAGDRLARKFKPADGDVTVINAMGIIGGAVPLTLISTIFDESGSPALYVGGAILGSLSGLTLGFRKTSKINYSRSDGNLIILGEVAGGLIGAGVATLLQTDGTSGAWFICAGLVGGFLISDSMVLKRKRESNTTGMNLSFDFNPMAFQNILEIKSFAIQPGKPVLNADLAKITWRL